MANRSMQSKQAQIPMVREVYHIQNEIVETKKAEDFAPFLQLIPLERLQTFFTSEVSKQTHQQQIDSTYKILPIDKAIGGEGPLSIIFDFGQTNPERYIMKLVCKQWQRLGDEAEIRYMETLHPKYQDKIWICDAKRTNKSKNKREADILKIKEIKNNIKTIIDSGDINDGDVILLRSCTIEIENFEYQEEYDDYSCHILEIKQNCKILGDPRSNSNQIEIHGTQFGEYKINEEHQKEFIKIGSEGGKPCRVTIANINFIPNDLIKCIHIRPNCSLELINCTFEASCTAIAQYGAELIMDGCKITSRGKCIAIGYHAGKVLIRNSQLICKADGYATCIEFLNQYGSRARSYNNNKQFVQLQCQNNRFISDKYPFVMDQYGQECNYEAKIKLTQSGNKWYQYQVSSGGYQDGKWYVGTQWNSGDKNTFKEMGRVFTKIYKRVGDNTDVFKE